VLISGRVAIQRRLIVYCIEEVDNGKKFSALFIPQDVRLYEE
jgi:DUF1680 family protein